MVPVGVKFGVEFLSLEEVEEERVILLFVVDVRVRGERKWNYATSAREWCGLSGHEDDDAQRRGLSKIWTSILGFYCIFFPFLRFRCNVIQSKN